VIQRIQTLLLVLAGISNILVFFTPIYGHAMDDPAQWIGWGFAIALTISMLASWASILKYNDRPTQISWVKAAMLLQVIAFGFGVGILFSLGGIGTYLWDEALSIGPILAGLILQYLAIHFIRKDMELVRSMDRIR
jgi:purine-cytosine permease-like protein